MAKLQKQWKKGAIYQVKGAAENERALEFIGTAKGVRDVGDVLMFRQQRKLKSKKRDVAQ
jgi:hypothetical protein